MRFLKKIVNLLRGISYAVTKNAKNWWRNRKTGAVIRVQAGDGFAYNWIVNYRYPPEMLKGTYEFELSNFIRETLKSGDMFFDIGANAGYFSLLAKMCVGQSGKVIAFEPSLENVAMMRAVLKANPLCQFEIEEAAIASEDGESEFLITNNPANGRLVNTSWALAKPSIATTSVRTLSLKPLIQKYEPKMIKIDTEGAEFLILKSLGFPSEWGCEPIFLLEFHGEEKGQKCFEMILSWGYNVFTLSGDRLIRYSNHQFVVAKSNAPSLGRT